MNSRFGISKIREKEGNGPEALIGCVQSPGNHGSPGNRARRKNSPGKYWKSFKKSWRVLEIAHKYSVRTLPLDYTT